MAFNSFSLQNKHLIITGASSGIGRQCAINFSKMGARVVLLGRDRARLKETVEKMDHSQQHTFYAMDLQSWDEVKYAVDEIVRKNGKIDGLVNSAGISTTLPFNLVTPEKMEHYFSVNVISAINLTRQAIKNVNFSEKGGSVIFLSSVMGFVGEKGKSLYAMTKGALNSVAKSLAIEYSDRKIRFNVISPGVVESPMSNNAVYSKDEKSLAKIKELHPLGLGKPEYIADAATFLLSDAACWVTGTSLVVDGGYMAR